MNTIKKNVYYCDFCKKNGLMAYHIKEHEIHCTANPNRECGMCDCKGLQNFIIGEFDENTKGVIFDNEDCPACFLAFVRQNKTQGYIREKTGKITVWSYTEAVKKYWEMIEEDYPY